MTEATQTAERDPAKWRDRLIETMILNLISMYRGALVSGL